ncbi:HNH endonuclease [Alloscardovia criceti]|uniref:HNH endonuclease n=1 Tax=Alloscardovia criceti TaxID=356828 RepID=UPI0014614EE4|nr:HNH endonuclease [Alloscardovia criceti]
MANSPSKEHSIKELIKREQHYELSDHEAADMLKLVTAFLDKQSSRKQIDVSVRKKLLLEQNGLCVMCGRRIGLQSHLDHKVPFVYVGDHLDDNFQMLCAHCNHAKGKKIDF